MILPTCLPLAETLALLTAERHTNNFDFLRLLAALMVVCGHASDILLAKPLEWDVARMLTGISLPKTGVMIFFVISGYLVTASWLKSESLFRYMTSRILRIFPAVIVLVFFSVFMLGPVVTTVSWEDYYTSDVTFRYLQNMSLFRMHYQLPGVFETNPYPAAVNGSLWTLPYEFTCYLFIAVLGLSFLLKQKWAVLIIFLCCFFSFIFFREENDAVVIPVLGIDFKNFTVLFLYFMSGSLYYLFRKEMPFSFYGLMFALVFCLLMRNGLVRQEVYIIILPYIILWFAFSKKIPLQQTGRYGDFSYGIFLYSFPVQQTLVCFFPETFNLPAFILCSLLCTLPLAVMSWHWVEKPALDLRKKLFH